MVASQAFGNYQLGAIVLDWRLFLRPIAHGVDIFFMFVNESSISYEKWKKKIEWSFYV